jgi:excinuclease ABC subunit A
VVAQGTPEQVAAHPTSYTGQFLRNLVVPEETPQKAPRRRKVAAAG